MSHKIKTVLGVLLLVVAVAIKGCDFLENPASPERGASHHLQHSDDEKQGRYFVLRDCHYLADKTYNDGDSFKIKTRDGRVVEVRLYYVDAAESKDKPYEDYRRRVADQGKDFGGLNYEKTIALGKEAKTYAEARLKSAELTIYTGWEEVYDSGRYYAFVKVGADEWWHETLVEKGLARIHTKGEELPDGTRYGTHKKELIALEKQAQRAKVGAWG
ncbi:MAG: endonuclease YncB(thermonuclease family), partial [Akkermansiaceae bacterium]